MILKSIDDLILEINKQNIKIYDKVKYHYPDGSAPNLLCAKIHIEAIFKWLNENNLLSKIGKEELSIPISADTIISSDMLTPEGKIIMDKHYNKWLQTIQYCKTPTMKTFRK